jgi:hypothetical protein
VARERPIRKRASSTKRKKGLTGAQLLKRGKERLHELRDVPGLGDATLYVRLTASDLLDFTELETEESDGKVSTKERADRQNDLLVKCLVDETGAPILTADQAVELAEMDWDVYMGVVRGVMAVISSKQEETTGDEATPLEDGESSPTS